MKERIRSEKHKLSEKESHCSLTGFFLCCQVIEAQMEVYEKSLKEARRCLLRKAEWGEAILPQPEVQSSCNMFVTDLMWASRIWCFRGGKST